MEQRSIVYSLLVAANQILLDARAYEMPQVRWICKTNNCTFDDRPKTEVRWKCWAACYHYAKLNVSETISTNNVRRSVVMAWSVTAHKPSRI